MLTVPQICNNYKVLIFSVVNKYFLLNLIKITLHYFTSQNILIVRLLSDSA